MMHYWVIRFHVYYGLSTYPLLVIQWGNLTIPKPGLTKIQHLAQINNHVE